MSKQLRIMPFYREQSTIKLKNIRNLNNAFTNFLLDTQLSNLNNLQVFFITILYKIKEQNYDYYWTQLKVIIDQMIIFFQKNNLVILAYSIELHRNIIKGKKPIFNNQKELNIYNKKHKTNYILIDNEIYNLISSNDIYNKIKLDTLPHLHFIIGLNNFQKSFNAILLQNDLDFFFKQNYDINVKDLIIKNESSKNFYNLINHFNYIWKNYNAKDAQYNTYLYFKDEIPFLGLFCYNLHIFNYLKDDFLKIYQQINIIILNKTTIKNNYEKYFFNSNELEYLCLNEFITFIYNNTSNYRFDFQYNFYILKTNTQFTFELFSDKFDQSIHYLYGQKQLLTNNYFYYITNNYSSFKYKLQEKLKLSNYPFFKYSGFEFLDTLLNNTTMCILKKSDLTAEQKNLTCFLYFPYNFSDYIDIIIQKLRDLQLNKFFYYNNLSFDFFYFLGLMFNKLSCNINPLLNINCYIYGKSSTAKTTFINNLLLNLFSTEKDFEFIIGKFEGFSSFQSQMIDKPIFFLDEFRYNPNKIPFYLANLSNSLKTKETKYEKTITLHTNPIAFFTNNKSPFIDLVNSINKRHKAFTNNFIPHLEINTNNTIQNTENYLNEILRFTPKEINYFYTLLRLKFNPESFLKNLNKKKQTSIKNFNGDSYTYFHTFNNYIDDFIHAEEYAFLRRLLIFDFDIPIDHIYSEANKLASLCKQELPFYFLISWIITSLSFYNSNIKNFITDAQFKNFFDLIYSFGFHKNSNYLIEKSEFFYNIPIKFKNTSFIICKRLNLAQYENNIELIFQTYISNYNNYKPEFHIFINNTNPLLLK